MSPYALIIGSSKTCTSQLKTNKKCILNFEIQLKKAVRFLVHYSTVQFHFSFKKCIENTPFFQVLLFVKAVACRACIYSTYK